MENAPETGLQTALGTPPSGGTVQIGTIVAYVGTNIPETWLLCDGNKIPGQYNTLIGIVGDYTPNLGGRTLIGAGTGTDSSGAQQTFTLKQTSGEFNNRLSIEQMPSHDHYLLFGNTSGHTNPQSVNWDTKNMTADHDNTSSTGGGQPHNNMQPYYVINYIIYAGTN